jgi:hypothetical protein
MADSKFYTKKMHEHCKAFFIENFEKIDSEYSNKFSKQFPDLYESSKYKDSNIFNFISESLKQGIDSNYSVHRDNDFIDYRLNYLNSNNWNKIVENTSYLDSHYVWYYFSPTCIPINIRELVVDKFNLLEEFYVNSVKSHVKQFYMRGHVKELWISLDLLFKNGFNKYMSQFNRFGPKYPNDIHSELINYTEGGQYGLLQNADLYAPFIDNQGNKINIQLLKFAFKRKERSQWHSPTNEPILFNFLINDLNLSPTEYLINKNLLDIYIAEQNEPINTLRSSIGLPRIGEGWISETKLFYQLKDEFSSHVVIQHFKPKWLGRQHFDIYFPLLNIAVEYQGMQHFESVEYFGGNKAFEQNLLRDKKKKELSKNNNCELICVEPGYDLNEICTLIRNSSNFEKSHDVLI